MFGTLFLNCDSVIQIHNHWVPLKKKMFDTLFLSEDWNPNLNFMWVPWQIWEHPWACFWIQAGFKSELNLRGSQFYYRLFSLSHSRLLSLSNSVPSPPSSLPCRSPPSHCPQPATPHHRRLNSPKLNPLPRTFWKSGSVTIVHTLPTLKLLWRFNPIRIFGNGGQGEVDRFLFLGAFCFFVSCD